MIKNHPEDKSLGVHMKALSRQLIRVTKLTLNAFHSVPNGEVPDRTGKGEMQIGICHFDPDESCSM